MQRRLPFFPSRFAPQYFDHMTARLKEALSAHRSDDVVRIASIGVSGSTFFKPIENQGSRVKRSSQAFIDEFKRLTSSVAKMNQEGTTLSLRFIWAYPYSDYAVHLKTAEKIEQRFFWEGPTQLAVTDLPPLHPTPDREQQELLDEYQSGSIADFDRLLKQLENSGVNLELNKVEARFTPVPLNFRGIFINRWAYYDIYGYSRMGADMERVASHLPVIAVNECGSAAQSGDVHKRYFQSLQSDFEYAWRHAATLLLDDAVDDDRKIRSPERVTHENKFADIDTWDRPSAHRIYAKLLCKHHFKKSVRINDGKATREHIFIGCSWEFDENNRHRPNHVGRDVYDFLQFIFSEHDDGDALSKDKRKRQAKNGKVVEAALVLGMDGDKLPEEIYGALNQASHGIIILTKDNLRLCGTDEDGRETPLDDLHFTRPNVVHELGYLNHRIRRLSKGDLLTLREKGAYYPTNEDAFPSRQFERHDMLSVYDKVMTWMAHNLCAFDQTAYDRSRKYLDLKGELAKAAPGRFPDSLQDYLALV